MRNFAWGPQKVAAQRSNDYLHMQRIKDKDTLNAWIIDIKKQFGVERYRIWIDSKVSSRLIGDAFFCCTYQSSFEAVWVIKLEVFQYILVKCMLID